MKRRRVVMGFTLMELLTVIIIVGILATLAVNFYNPSKEDALDREAWLNLKIIRSAELTHRMDTGNYYPVPPAGPDSNIANINQELRLSLSEAAARSWNYTVWNNGCARATRNGDDGRSWYLRVTDNGSNPVNLNLDGEPNDSTVYTCP